MLGEIKEALAGLSNSDQSSDQSSDTTSNDTSPNIAELAQKIYSQISEGLSGKADNTLSATA